MSNSKTVKTEAPERTRGPILITSDLHLELKILAARRRQYMNDLVERALREWLAGQPTGEPKKAAK